MSFRADLALYDKNGRLTAVAEVMNRLGTSPTWAARTRRNLLAHGSYQESDFFLLATPERLYVWKDAGTTPVERLPTYDADSRHLFAPYFRNAGIDPHEVSGQAFELLVASWLSDLTRLPNTHDDGGQKKGHIEYEALA